MQWYRRNNTLQDGLLEENDQLQDENINWFVLSHNTLMNESTH